MTFKIKFKAGDKVRVISVCSGSVLRVGDVVEVDYVTEHFLYPKGYHTSAMYLKRFELVETHFPLYSEKEAVSLLTERGYKVEAPPEPMKGKMIVYRNAIGEIWPIDEKRWDLWGSSVQSAVTVLAIVDWVEGMGLPNKE